MSFNFPIYPQTPYFYGTSACTYVIMLFSSVNFSDVKVLVQSEELRRIEGKLLVVPLQREAMSEGTLRTPE